MSNHAFIFSLVFLAFICLGLALRTWLSYRQIRHVQAHRQAVPAEFADVISLSDHQKAADYTICTSRNSLHSFYAETLLLLLLTLHGGLHILHEWLGIWFTPGGYAHGIALFAAVSVISFCFTLPFALYRTFRIEVKFGFNKMSFGLWLADLLKSTLLGVVIGAPLLFAVLWLMQVMGSFWWFYVWLLWFGFGLLMHLIYPTFIAPLFNKFTPLEESALKTRIEALLMRCGFTSAGLFVMDGSKRSAHGNAYFTGFGAAKRIVFFDTLLTRLEPQETEAVLAHELGHYKRRHIVKRIVMMALTSLVLLWVLGVLMEHAWFFAGLGIGYSGTAVALLLFSLALPVFLFPLTPLSSWLSRRHEYEADAYAAAQTQANDLIHALVKLYRDNAATLTPDPLHSLFYDSHPPASLRIAHLHSCES